LGGLPRGKKRLLGGHTPYSLRDAVDHGVEDPFGGQ
jgi:hypothetical protein